MFDDVGLVERRVRRELWERVLPLVHREHRPLTIAAGPGPDDLRPFAAGQMWGPPWGTTWFRFDGDVPEHWTGRRVEARIDLGFDRSPPGFQCEGLVVDRFPDGTITPRHGLHPRRMTTAVAAIAGPVTIWVEAASNPSFPQFRPSPLGSPTTAGDDPLYRFRGAELVLVDPDVEALVHDLDVLSDLMRVVPDSDPRRARIAVSLGVALDRIARTGGPDRDDVAAARRALAPELVPLDGGPGRHRVVATGHAHLDTAWLWPLRETVRKCVRTFASAVELLDADSDHRFSCSQAQQYAWVEQSHPELFERIREHVAAGRWIPVGGMWVEADMNLPSGESLVRQIVFGQRWFEEHFGEPCREVWIPDVFGYPAGLPQMFVAGGMHRFVTQKLSWNQQNRFPHHTFRWEGLDGSSVLAHFPPVDTYNAEVTPTEIAHAVANFRDHGWSSASLLPFGHGDGGGGPTADMLERRRRMARLDTRVEIEVGAPSDFFERVEAEIAAGAAIPTWRGELYFEMHRGTLTSQLETKLGNRRCERRLVEAELWAATSGVEADLDELWREVLTLQFHDILPGSSIAWVHDEAEATFERVAADLDQRIHEQLNALLPAGRWLVNPADVAVDGVVVVGCEPAAEVQATSDSGSARDDAGTTSDTGSHVRGADAEVCQRLADGRVAVVAHVPALGAAPTGRSTRGAPPGRVVVGDGSMVSSSLAVRWSTAGVLTSVIDVVRARECLPAGAAAAVLELAPDRPVEYDAWDLEEWTRAGASALDGPADVEVLDEGPLVGRVRVTRTFGPSTATVTYELRAGMPELLVHVDLDWRHDEHLLSMGFPLDVRADRAACDVQFGVVHRPTHRSTSWDAAKYEVCAHRFVDLSEPSFGVAVLNDGRYGHCVFDGAVRVSLARAAKYPDPTADRGIHRVTLAMMPHGAGLGAVRNAASRLNAPVRAVTIDPAPSGVTETGAGTGIEIGPDTDRNIDRNTDPGTRRGPFAPVVALYGPVPDDPSPDGVQLDAVKLADDGSGDLIVRLHEACGDRAQVVVATRRRVASAWRCDLLERPGPGEEVGDGVVTLRLRPFELVTLRLRLGGDDGRDRTVAPGP